jgi:membrane-bound serine protease (ClpP class)
MNTHANRFRWLAAFLAVVLLTLSALADQDPAPAPALPAPPAAPAAPAALQPVHDKAALIRLSATVDNMMKKSLERRIDQARKAGCTLIVLQVDTYGGLVTSALEISKMLKQLPAEGIHTAAWVNNKAYSAGSLISVACQQIYIVNAGTIGDCAPIRVDDEHRLVPLPADERAKITSPILQEFDDSADRNGLSKTLLRAMVVASVEIHEVRNATTGETRFVDTDTKNKLHRHQEQAPRGRSPGSRRRKRASMEVRPDRRRRQPTAHAQRPASRPHGNRQGHRQQ